MWTDALATRRAVAESTKKRVAASQRWQCSACKELLPSTFQVDHIMPLAVGGSNEVSNLTAMCPGCHAEKTQDEHVRVDAYRDIMKQLKNTSGSACWHCGSVYSTYFKHTCAPRQ